MNRIAILGWLIALMLARAEAAVSFQKDDVISFIGGEQMVAASESGEIELALTVAHPDLHLRFRSLAWEGDTVFEQRRDLNYPPLEDQLKRAGTTVVVTGFGALESLAPGADAARFKEAYAHLLESLGSAGASRFVLIVPAFFEQVAGVPLDRGEANRQLVAFQEAIRTLARERKAELIDPEPALAAAPQVARWTRDGLHWNVAGQKGVAELFAPAPPSSPAVESLRRLIATKNQLWFYYTRPQNWAFLAGDRTNQPSSRDHRDFNKRWFPEEMEQFKPLIEAREAEIAQASVNLK